MPILGSEEGEALGQFAPIAIVSIAKIAQAAEAERSFVPGLVRAV